MTAVQIPAGRENDELLTAAQVARRAGVTPQAVANWVRRGKLNASGIDTRGRALYWWLDAARVEKATRRGARRNVALRMIATDQIPDTAAIIVRLDCKHLRILSTSHAPVPGRQVACFECAKTQPIHHIVDQQAA